MSPRSFVRGVVLAPAQIDFIFPEWFLIGFFRPPSVLRLVYKEAFMVRTAQVRQMSLGDFC